MHSNIIKANLPVGLILKSNKGERSAPVIILFVSTDAVFDGLENSAKITCYAHKKRYLSATLIVAPNPTETNAKPTRSPLGDSSSCAYNQPVIAGKILK